MYTENKHELDTLDVSNVSNTGYVVDTTYSYGTIQKKDAILLEDLQGSRNFCTLTLTPAKWARIGSLEKRRLSGILSLPIVTWKEVVVVCGSLVSSPKKKVMGWEKMASNYTKRCLDGILGKASSLKGWSAIQTGCPGK